MAIDTGELLSRTNIIDTVNKYVHLKKTGAEHIGVCPFHEDKTESLKVNESKQIFKCFACGTGGDSLEFLQRLGRTFVEACEELNGGKIDSDLEIMKVTPKQKTIQAPEWVNISPIPFEPTSFAHSRMGEPSMKWAYKNEQGQTIGFVCRFDLDDGSKQVLPLSFFTNGKVSKFRWGGLNLPRPIYNLDLISKNPNASILIVEGEKTADAAQVHFKAEKTVVTTWIGGANGIVNADFSPLNERKIIFLPDHDTEQKYGNEHPKSGQVKPWNEQPGNQAMLNIYESIKNDITLARWVNVPDEMPHKWDVADKTDWKENEMREFIRVNLSDVPEVPEAVDVAPEPVQVAEPIESPKNPELPPVKKSDFFQLENEHYRLLGYDKDENSRLVYFFFSYESKSVIKLSPSSMTKSNLMMLAPINYWESEFTGNKSKVNLDAAQQFLMSNSCIVGQFRDKYIRGRGAWMDDETLVVHTGENLLIKGETIPLKQYKSKYVYEIGENLGFGNDKPLTTAESSVLIDKINFLKFEREINAYLLAGWCVIAPFCGVLNWRPHIWLTGPAGSGKSHVMEHIIKKLMGEVAIAVQGKTTEAGVRGMLQCDARPVLFDETDVDSHADKERIQGVLALARASSYSDGGVIGKGTQSGASRTYTVRSCFAFSSIGVQLNQQSDRSRFTTLGLLAFEQANAKEEFSNFERDWNKCITKDYVDSLHSRTMEMLPVILKNSRTFADAVSKVIGNRRIGDQVGSMLAGAYSLTSKNEIDFDDAVKWVESKDWTDERSLELTKDENQLFSVIMGHHLSVETTYSKVDRSIGELILIAANKMSELGLDSSTADQRLRRIGIMINGENVIFANTASGLKAIIANTSWSNNHNKILERLPNSEKTEPRTFFPGLKSRGVMIPIASISDGYDFGSRKPSTPEPTIQQPEHIDFQQKDLPF